MHRDRHQAAEPGVPYQHVEMINGFSSLYRCKNSVIIGMTSAGLDLVMK
jgi:hypothetical protein